MATQRYIDVSNDKLKRSGFDMRTYYCKENTIIHFLNQNEEDGKWVNELNIGNKYEYYPLNIKENGLMIVKL